MGRIHDEIGDGLRAWVVRQPVFYVATAPLAAGGHVNCSPKGPAGALQVLGPRRVAYLDAAGSGAETIAHLRENGRIVVMLCAFEGAPRVVRFHGRGEAIVKGDARFEELLARAPFADPSLPEARRALVVVDVVRISESCGYGVPLMAFEGVRDHHVLTTAKRLRALGQDGYARHRADVNARSIDGLPALADSRWAAS
jgi:hypothetical protein